MKKQSFFAANKVFFLGLLASLTVVVQQFAQQQAVDYKAFGFAALMAVLSFVANEWRGQGVTITGIVGTLASVFVTNLNGSHVNWNQLILLSVAAVLAAVAPPPKAQSYEDNPVIRNAKLILVLFIVSSFFTSCALLQKAQAPKYDESAVQMLKLISSETDSLYTVIQGSPDKSFQTYAPMYLTVTNDIGILARYDSTRKHAGALLVIVNDAKERFENYTGEHSLYVRINNSQALAYKEGMRALLNILLRTETHYKK